MAEHWTKRKPADFDCEADGTRKRKSPDYDCEADDTGKRKSADFKYRLIRRHTWSEAEQLLMLLRNLYIPSSLHIAAKEGLARSLMLLRNLCIAAKEGHALIRPKLLPVAAAAEEGHANIQPNYLWQDCDDYTGMMKVYVERCPVTLFAMTNVCLLELHLDLSDENGVATKFLRYWPKLAEAIQAFMESIKLDGQTLSLMAKDLDCEIQANNKNIMVKLEFHKSKGSTKHRSERSNYHIQSKRKTRYPMGKTKLESLDDWRSLEIIIVKDDMAFMKSLTQTVLHESKVLGGILNASDENGHQDLVEHSRSEFVGSISCKSRQHRSNLAENIQPSLESIELKRQTPGKMKLQSLDQSPPDTTTWYLEITMKSIPAVAAAMVAIQSAVNPPGGRWPEDTPLHKAGDAVIAYTHPNIYKYLMLTNSVALSSSLLAIFLFITGWQSTSTFIRWTTKFATWVSLLAIAMSYVGSTMAIAPHEKTKSVDPIVLISVMLVSIIFTIVISTFHPLIVFYLDWKRKIQCEEDLTTDHLPKRILYRIFQLWDMLSLPSGS